MGLKVLSALWETLLTEFPFLSPAAALLTPATAERIACFATDGRHLYFNAERVLSLYKTNEKFLLRALLHTVFHCLYGHLWLDFEEPQNRRDLSSDIFTEQLLDEVPSNTLKRPLSWIRQQIYERMKKEKAVSPGQIDALISEQCEDEGVLTREFVTDDHRFWPDKAKADPKQNAQQELLKKAWEEAARQVSSRKKEFEKDPGRGGSSVEFEPSLYPEKKRSYRSFLRRFSVLAEECRSNPEEFDLISYTYGLKLYGNMPLVEPLESREELRVRDFVIAVDTSYSTSGDLVKSFLREAFQILLEREAFAGGTRVHVLQCDDAVRAVDCVRSRKDVERLIKELRLAGGGGTDFRPVFAYVNEMRRKKKMRKPSGLLYFTDGLGHYPKKSPDYKTAFLFLNDYDKDKVPAWCIDLRLNERELR